MYYFIISLKKISERFEFFQCSVTCGKGRKSRDIQCLDTYGVPSNRCDIRQKPTEVELCKQSPCTSQTVSGMFFYDF